MAGLDIDKLVALSGAVQLDDLDWDLCAKIGVTDTEERVLRYMADTETHTILYMRDLLAGYSARDPDITAFLSVWVYEELWHGRALSMLLEKAGRPEPKERYSEVVAGGAFHEVIEAVLSHGLASLTPRFIAVHMTWGAINELTAGAAYDALAARSANPVLVELLARIVKQERKHFSFYYHQAEKRLQGEWKTQALVRTAIRHFWSVVGNGVGGAENLEFISAHYFQGTNRELLVDVERRIQNLPGMEWFDMLTKQVDRMVERYVEKHGPVPAEPVLSAAE